MDSLVSPDAMLRKELLSPEKRKPKPADRDLTFGRHFSDHMLVMDYQPSRGWFDTRIIPYQPFQMDPASLVLHYGQGVFEGMKAYRSTNGGICMFRPKDNIERLNRSAKRLCIPELPLEHALDAVLELIRVEQDWVPRSPGTSLYIRPTMIATEACLGVKVSSDYRFFVIVGPVGAYYPEGFNPVKIWVEENYIRAARGGLGEAKTMANYAASLLATKEAKAKGYTQVLWLDATDRRSIDEVGTMNMFFKIGGEVITAPLDGCILPGVTRASVIELCKHWGVPVSERRITIDEVLDAHRDGHLEEAFGTGTAAVISPVGLLHYRGEDITVGDGKTGAFSLKLYDELTGIQLGQRPDPAGWVIQVA